MNRDHRVFTFMVSFDRQVMAPDPPGSGEMHKTGQIDHDTGTIVAVATSRAFAEVWLRNPYRFPNLEIHGCIETKIDAVIETHTY